MIQLGNVVHGHSIAALYDGTYNELTDVVISSVSDDEHRLLGGVIFSDYNKASIAVSAAGIRPNWISRDLLWITFHYPFVQLGCRMVLAKTSSANHKSLSLLLRLGLNEVARISGACPDGDLVVLRILERDCKWHKITPSSKFKDYMHGQE